MSGSEIEGAAFWRAVASLAAEWGVEPPARVTPTAAARHRGACSRCGATVHAAPKFDSACVACGPPPLVRTRLLAEARPAVERELARVAEEDARARAVREVELERVQSHARDIAELMRLRAENEPSGTAPSPACSFQPSPRPPAGRAPASERDGRPGAGDEGEGGHPRRHPGGWSGVRAPRRPCRPSPPPFHIRADPGKTA